MLMVEASWQQGNHDWLDGAQRGEVLEVGQCGGRKIRFVLVRGRVVLVFDGSPDRIRTGATALRGRRPGPLDDGAAALGCQDSNLD
jgi:hypothetical protein